MATREQAHGLHVADVQLDPLVVLDPGATLRDAARALKGSGFGAALVDAWPLVECTDADIVHAIAAGDDAGTPVGSLALDAPPFVHSTSTIADALQLMWALGRRGVLVVSRDGRPLGYLAATVAFAALRAGPPWLGALKIALHIEEERL
jgi:CBS domain-containing protein